jgi:signal transduction histidine kinase
VATGDEERRRVVRDLHDGGQRRLVHTIMTLELACGALADGDVSRLPLTVATHVSVERLQSVVKTTAQFIVAEAADEHRQARSREARRTVSVDVDDGTLRIPVRDDGVGGARPDGSGLVGLRDRLAASAAGSGPTAATDPCTLVAAEIPLSGHRVATAAPAAGVERLGSPLASQLLTVRGQYSGGGQPLRTGV